MDQPRSARVQVARPPPPAPTLTLIPTRWLCSPPLLLSPLTLTLTLTRWLCSPPVILSLVFLFVYSIVVYIGLVRRPSMPVVVVVGGGGSNPFGRLVSFRISQRS